MRTCELIWGTARPVAARGWAKSNPEFGNLIAPQKGEHSTSSISAVGYSQLMARMLPSAAGFHVPTTTNQSESYHSPAVRGRLIASPGYLTSHRLADLVLHSAGGRGTSHSGSQKVLLESLLVPFRCVGSSLFGGSRTNPPSNKFADAFSLRTGTCSSSSESQTGRSDPAQEYSWYQESPPTPAAGRPSRTRTQ